QSQISQRANFRNIIHKKHIQTGNRFSEGGKLYRIAELTMQIPKSTTHRWEFRLSCVCAQV
ncbi:MAG: hypothetical protein WCR91_07980, partial [Sphaerochaetaceae bacterium]